MDFPYVVAPIAGYLLAGVTKFIINSFKYKKLAFDEIGMGNMPSTHNTITSSIFFTLGFGEGFFSPICGVGLALMLVVSIDSLDLRKKIEGHAKIIFKEFSHKNSEAALLRLKLSHSIPEVLGGIALGAIIGYTLIELLPLVESLFEI